MNNDEIALLLAAGSCGLIVFLLWCLQALAERNNRVAPAVHLVYEREQIANALYTNNYRRWITPPLGESFNDESESDAPQIGFYHQSR